MSIGMEALAPSHLFLVVTYISDGNLAMLGAQALLDQHGCEHMQEIGQQHPRTLDPVRRA
jgi:hypothetical protein